MPYSLKALLKKSPALVALVRPVQRARCKAAIRAASKLKYFNRAKTWIERYTIPGAGICVTSKIKKSYPEVSGYFIPTLLNWGMRDLAAQYAKWLCSIQKPDGSWYGPDDKDPYIFDIAQILKGLLAISEIMPEVEANILKGCDWLLSRINDEGRLIAPSQALCLFDNKFSSELIHIYCLPPLIEAAKKYDRPVYGTAARRVLNYYKTNYRNEILDFKILSHFYAYIIEGLVDLGETELAKEAMAKVSVLQKRNGAIPGYRYVKWVCSTGLFQFALIYYKLGDKEHGDKAFNYALRLQNKSGGWYGTYPVNIWYFSKICAKIAGKITGNRLNDYFRNAEISWAVKYFLDALQQRLASEFNDASLEFHNDIESDDPLYLLVKSSIEKTTGGVILDAGCSKGRYLKRLRKDKSDLELHGCDLSLKALEYITPNEIKTKQGSLLNLPYNNESFDMVYTCEALEFCINLDGALAEMVRIVKHGGYILIIDKNIRKLGSMRITEWEQWFDIQDVSRRLERLGCTVTVYHNLVPETHNGIFYGWLAKKD